MALACGAVAVLSANISALMPDNLLAGLHASRLDGASLAQMRRQIANLQVEAGKLGQQNALLASRFSLAEQSDNAVVRRVGALELSVPKLLEALPPGADVDRSTITSSIGGRAVTLPAQGGWVSVRQEPYDPSMVAGDGGQPMPSLPADGPQSVTPDADAFGVAVGSPVGAAGAPKAWTALIDKVGPLLLWLGPLVGDQPLSEGRLVAGPLPSLAQADALCGELARAGMSCQSVPFTGAHVKP